MPVMGVFLVPPFQAESEEQEAQLKMLEIIGDSGKTELCYQLSNVRKQLLLVV